MGENFGAKTMKLVYMRTDEYNHFICVHESQLNDAKTALKDIDGISYIRGADTDKFRFKPVDIWVAIVHDIKLQVLDALKTAGFEFSDMVQKDYVGGCAPGVKIKEGTDIDDTLDDADVESVEDDNADSGEASTDLSYDSSDEDLIDMVMGECDK